MGHNDFQISVVRSSGTFELNDRENWFVTAVGGVSVPPNSRFIERSALQHGATNRGFRLQPRYFDIVLETVASSEQTYWEGREEVSRIFAPESGLFSVKFEMGTLTRQIDCSTRGIVTGGSNDRKVYKQKWGIQFVAPDPLFYDPTRISALIDGWGGTGFTVPITVPFDFGSSSVDQIEIMSNAGSWETFPEIQIVGPLDDIVITNTLTGYKLDFTGLALGLGEERVIDTRFDAKSVVDESGVNKISDLTADSDLTAFSILVGENPISIVGSAADSNTQIIFRYYKRYVAI